MPTRNDIKAKADEIRGWFDTCDINKMAHKSALKRAAQMVLSRQTEREVAMEDTVELNGRGFNGLDGNFGTRIAKWRGNITVKMASGAKKMLRKYARQLAEIKLGMP